ncbi:MAG: hypothetical protein ACFFCW_26855, partial [Candidatus Hodarchaeota archaeon]
WLVFSPKLCPELSEYNRFSPSSPAIFDTCFEDEITVVSEIQMISIISIISAHSFSLLHKNFSANHLLQLQDLQSSVHKAQ